MSPKIPPSGPHTRSRSRVGNIMTKVMLAASPATAYGIYIYGWPALNIFLITILAAIAFEAICLKLSGKPIRVFLFDGSAVLSAWLIAMTLPPWAPWWIGVTGAAIAIVIGKQVFGGIGQNLFNPAMLARVALLVSFPLQMTTWIDPIPFNSEGAPNFLEGLQITFGEQAIPDGVTGATMLGHIKTEFSRGTLLEQALESGDYSLTNSSIGYIAGSLGETSALLLLLGGLWMIYKKIIGWQIPVALLATVFILSSTFHLISPERYAGPLFHICSGALMCTAFFIATDYVTSPNSAVGQLIFGAGCGLLIFIIRSWGAYPEGAGFAVLLMNSATPLIDNYFRPRIYGRSRDGKPLETEQGDA